MPQGKDQTHSLENGCRGRVENTGRTVTKSRSHAQSTGRTVTKSRTVTHSLHAVSSTTNTILLSCLHNNNVSSWGQTTAKLEGTSIFVTKQHSALQKLKWSQPSCNAVQWNPRPPARPVESTKIARFWMRRPASRQRVRTVGVGVVNFRVPKVVTIITTASRHVTYKLTSYND